MYHCFLIFFPSSTFLAVSWLTRAETKQQHSNCLNVYFSSDVKNQVKTSRKGKENGTRQYLVKNNSKWQSARIGISVDAYDRMRYAIQ